ncbi:MAG: hypothetical protein A2X80_04250 [Geobacteraceae bacterium GWB2_52_12]|nr:MAG: hypothetical protein A2X80_04250 [Geobacteraceae bacterium GWB2_52_12]
MTLGIGRALKRLRIERKLTQKELAIMVSGGVDYTYIGKIEREEQLPSLKILINISKALAVPLSSLFSEENDGCAALPVSSKVVNLADAREMSHLLKELNQLHRNDIPLLMDIIRALNGHRKHQTRGSYTLPDDDQALVAEASPHYEEKE